VAISITKDGTEALGGIPTRRTAAFAGTLLLIPPVLGLVAAVITGAALVFILVAMSLSFVALAWAAYLLAQASDRGGEREKSLSLERSAAAASRALLKRDSSDPVGTALAALLEGTDTAAVFLETNTDEDVDEHGNTPTVRDILHRADGSSESHWELTGWRVGGPAHRALAGGESFVTVPARLDSITCAMYRAYRIGSELLLPITTEGIWVGSVGLASRDPDRRWSPGEEQLLRFAAEMIGVYWERRDNQGRLEELIRTKDEFIASVSHEVRTPLTAVLGFAHELDEDPDRFNPAERAEAISLIVTQSQEVANIVDDLLIAARADAGTIAVAPAAVPVRDIVGDVLASHRSLVDFLAVGEEEPVAWADPARLRQIMRNLLTNADRYGGDRVRIHVGQAGGVVTLDVRDNGEGIPARLRDHVFEPYARAHHGSKQPASVGLGLAVARKLALLMDGNLELYRDNGWTVFSLTLPAAVPAPTAAVSAARRPVTTS
jgi:signal transduction histidine kinase